MCVCVCVGVGVGVGVIREAGRLGQNYYFSCPTS